MNFKDIARDIVTRNNDVTITEDNVAGFLDALLVLDEMVEDFDPTLEEIQEFINKGIMAALFAGWIDHQGDHVAYEPVDKDTVWEDLKQEYVKSRIEAGN